MQKLLSLALVLLLVSVACSTSSDAPGEEVDWVEPADYDFVLESGCGERTLLGSFSIEVRDHMVEAATALDESAEVMLASTGIDPVLTIRELVDEALGAQQSDADVATIAVDPSDGRPIRIDIDWKLDATDDEACYVITAYTPTG